MKRYTIAVDFDGVLHSYQSPWVAAHVIPDPPVEGAMAWLATIAQDFDVVIHTTRGRTWRGRRAVRRWLNDRYAFSWQHRKWRVTDRKVPALLYVDDRGWRFTGSRFPTKDDIHAARPWNKRRPIEGGS